jgi:hypothetical protein
MAEKKSWGFIFYVLYVVLGLYFINIAFQIITIPASIVSFEKWIFIASGVLLLLGAYFFSKYRKENLGF